MSATDTKRATAATVFSGMNRSLDYELQTPPSLGQTEKKPALRCRACLPVISLGRIQRGNGDLGGRITPSRPFRSERFAASARQFIAGRCLNVYDVNDDRSRGDRMKVARDFDQVLHAALRLGHPGGLGLTLAAARSILAGPVETCPPVRIASAAHDPMRH